MLQDKILEESIRNVGIVSAELDNNFMKGKNDLKDWEANLNLVIFSFLFLSYHFHLLINIFQVLSQRAEELYRELEQSYTSRKEVKYL